MNSLQEEIPKEIKNDDSDELKVACATAREPNQAEDPPTLEGHAAEDGSLTKDCDIDDQLMSGEKNGGKKKKSAFSAPTSKKATNQSGGKPEKPKKPRKNPEKKPIVALTDAEYNDIFQAAISSSYSGEDEQLPPESAEQNLERVNAEASNDSQLQQQGLEQQEESVHAGIEGAGHVVVPVATQADETVEHSVTPPARPTKKSAEQLKAGKPKKTGSRKTKASKMLEFPNGQKVGKDAGDTAAEGTDEPVSQKPSKGAASTTGGEESPAVEVGGQSIWIQCTNPGCLKWRYLTSGFDDPADIPEVWTCSMNPDEQFNSCKVAEEQWDTLDDSWEYVICSYSPGSLAWAKLTGYPWWPAMLDIDLEVNSFFELNERTSHPAKYHVVFLGSKASRAWIQATSLRKFTGNEMTDIDQQPIKVNTNKKDWLVAKEMATKALSMTLKERIFNYGIAASHFARSLRKKIIRGSSAKKTEQKVENESEEFDLEFSSSDGEDLCDENTKLAVNNFIESELSHDDDDDKDLLMSSDGSDYENESPKLKKTKKANKKEPAGRVQFPANNKAAPPPAKKENRKKKVPDKNTSNSAASKKPKMSSEKCKGKRGDQAATATSVKKVKVQEKPKPKKKGFQAPLAKSLAPPPSKSKESTDDSVGISRQALQPSRGDNLMMVDQGESVPRVPDKAVCGGDDLHGFAVPDSVSKLPPSPIFAAKSLDLDLPDKGNGAPRDDTATVPDLSVLDLVETRKGGTSADLVVPDSSSNVVDFSLDLFSDSHLEFNKASAMELEDGVETDSQPFE